MSTEKFQYITDKDFPKLCLSICTVLEKIDEKQSRCIWTVSMKSPSDRFNKQAAREAISLNKNRPYYSGEIILTNDYNRYEIVMKILMQLTVNDSQFSSTYRSFIFWKIMESITN